MSLFSSFKPAEILYTGTMCNIRIDFYRFSSCLVFIVLSNTRIAILGNIASDPRQHSHEIDCDRGSESLSFSM